MKALLAVLFLCASVFMAYGQESIRVHDGINVGMHAGIALLMSFGILGPVFSPPTSSTATASALVTPTKCHKTVYVISVWGPQRCFLQPSTAPLELARMSSGRNPSLPSRNYRSSQFPSKFHSKI